MKVNSNQIRMYVEFLTWDYTCPISCGQCCLDCLKLTTLGCSLKRELRPWPCRAYLCKEGEKAFLQKIFSQN